ncbi:MAG: hypothetical protein CMG09_05915 [Candidatus Marinimicrobia bacterium]|nr:hypothetical protein [Candidatus Neomarinimicrobiota bacterium]|tara:strand:- start:49 stop:1464 length:1416 start_codon:yes stop_codon:yes gene_type:complete
MNNTKNYYQILGLKNNCTKSDIKKAYRKLAIKFHPDKNPNDDGYFVKLFRSINEAYEVLSNDDKRKKYDDLFNQQDSTEFDDLNQTDVEDNDPETYDINADDNESPVTIIIALNFIMYVIVAISGGSFFTSDLDALYNWGALYNTDGTIIKGVYSTLYDGTYWRLVASQFLHADLKHILFNMYVLYMIGIPLLGFIKKEIFLIVYISTGVIASLSSSIFGNYTISVGASGAIFGIAGFYCSILYLFKENKMYDNNEEIINEQFKSVLFFLGINFIIGFIFPNIDNYAHLGGLVSGVVIGFIYINYYLSSNKREYKNNEKTSLIGIGGWLIIFALHQIIILFIKGIPALMNLLDKGFSLGLTKTQIFDLVDKYRISEIVIMNNAEIAISMLLYVDLILLLVSTYLFFTYKKYFLSFFLCRCLYTMLSFVVLNSYRYFDSSYLMFGLFMNFIFCLIYYFYFTKSKRVKYTFVA